MKAKARYQQKRGRRRSGMAKMAAASQQAWQRGMAAYIAWPSARNNAAREENSALARGKRAVSCARSITLSSRETGAHGSARQRASNKEWRARQQQYGVNKRARGMRAAISRNSDIARLNKNNKHAHNAQKSAPRQSIARDIASYQQARAQQHNAARKRASRASRASRQHSMA